jgi:hypothetical protein
VEGSGENAMTVSRRVAQLGLGAAILILIGCMAIVFVGSSQGKEQTPARQTSEPQTASYTIPANH